MLELYIVVQELDIISAVLTSLSALLRQYFQVLD